MSNASTTLSAVTLTTVQQARERINGFIVNSPCRHSVELSQMTGADIHLKLDNVQRTGAFKERGALNKILLLSEDERRRGVIAASRGGKLKTLLQVVAIALYVLPLPAALLWIVASGLGCLRTRLAPDTHVADMSEARDCLMFIVGLSVPLSALLIMMLRRACTLQPGLTAAIAGLAAAAAAATLLNFFHPFDAAATDLAVHAVAVALVISANRAFSGRLLAPSFTKH